MVVPMVASGVASGSMIEVVSLEGSTLFDEVCIQPQTSQSGTAISQQDS